MLYINKTIPREMKEKWCSRCNLEMDDPILHSNVHRNDDLKCQLCSKTFSSRSHLMEHLMCHTSKLSHSSENFYGVVFPQVQGCTNVISATRNSFPSVTVRYTTEATQRSVRTIAECVRNHSGRRIL